MVLSMPREESAIRTSEIGPRTCNCQLLEPLKITFIARMPIKSTKFDYEEFAYQFEEKDFDDDGDDYTLNCLRFIPPPHLSIFRCALSQT